MDQMLTFWLETDLRVLSDKYYHVLEPYSKETIPIELRGSLVGMTVKYDVKINVKNDTHSDYATLPIIVKTVLKKSLNQRCRTNDDCESGNCALPPGYSYKVCRLKGETYQLVTLTEFLYRYWYLLIILGAVIIYFLKRKKS